MAQASGSSGEASSSLTQLPWQAIPRFIPGQTDVSEYSKKAQFLAAIWPKEHLHLMAPRMAFLAEGTAFKQLTRLEPSKLQAEDTSGVEAIVSALGGTWGQTKLESKYEYFERSLFGTVQKSDESNDSYLARHDCNWEELLSQNTTLNEVRAYVLLRQSGLSAEDRKKIVVEQGGVLDYTKVRGSLRLLGSRFFNELQGRGANTRSKTYNVNYTDQATVDEEDAPQSAYTAHAPPTEDPEPDLDMDFIEAMCAQEDSDALMVMGFENELEEDFQETPELQSALISYMDARNRLKEKQRSRGFWPVGSSKGRGKSKGFGKSAGKGRKGRDREALLQRIARSHCRLCGKKGHWRLSALMPRHRRMLLRMPRPR